MAGFTYAYRLQGGAPTIMKIVAADTAYTKGDLVNLESGQADLAATNDAALLGQVLETSSGLTAGTDRIDVIVDQDAVYSVEDNNARTMGDTLDISGATGAQGVAASSNVDVLVIETSTATQPTLVRIATGESWLD